MKYFRSDRGGEYVGGPFISWSKERGITHETTTAYSRKSNGSADGPNRTLILTPRIILMELDPRIAEILWTEAANTANYIRNGLVTSSGQPFCTLYEAITGRKRDLTSLHVFGCRAFVHIPKSNQDGKFSQRSKKGIMVVYWKGNAYGIFFLTPEQWSPAKMSLLVRKKCLLTAMMLLLKMNSPSN